MKRKVFALLTLTIMTLMIGFINAKAYEDKYPIKRIYTLYEGIAGVNRDDGPVNLGNMSAAGYDPSNPYYHEFQSIKYADQAKLRASSDGRVKLEYSTKEVDIIKNFYKNSKKIDTTKMLKTPDCIDGMIVTYNVNASTDKAYECHYDEVNVNGEKKWIFRNPAVEQLSYNGIIKYDGKGYKLSLGDKTALDLIREFAVNLKYTVIDVVKIIIPVLISIFGLYVAMRILWSVIQRGKIDA